MTTTATCLVVLLFCFVPITVFQLQGAIPILSSEKGSISYEQYLELPSFLAASTKHLQPSNAKTTTKLTLDEAINSATGKLFKGDVIRNYTNARYYPNYNHEETASRTKQQSPIQPRCDKWNVVTTIFAPSVAVQRAASVSDWCIVIVADTKTPLDYMQTAELNDNPRVQFLSVVAQEEWRQQELSQNSDVGKFLDAIPFKHFGRKNIGYLYAIQHGARILFDFDDDNLLPLDDKKQVLPPLTNTTHLEGVRLVESKHVAFNHHPLLGAPIENSWARGFPLEYIQTSSTHGKVAKGATTIAIDESVAVMQFCANGNPDIDAIHRLVHPLPMMFGEGNSKQVDSMQEGISTSGALVVPTTSFAPYNAQATLHSYKAMWALLLPMTVPGRVSDIWRAFFAQAIFRDAGLSLAMLPPNVMQERNEHNYLADMQAELDLYFKGGKLLEFLSAWKSDAPSIPARMEELWIALYERSYIELDDVKVLQYWLAALEEVEYAFPP